MRDMIDFVNHSIHQCKENRRGSKLNSEREEEKEEVISSKQRTKKSRRCQSDVLLTLLVKACVRIGAMTVESIRTRNGGTGAILR